MATTPILKPKPAVTSGIEQNVINPPAEAATETVATATPELDPVLEQNAQELINPQTVAKKEIAPTTGLAPLPAADNPDDVDTFILSLEEQKANTVTQADMQDLIGLDPVEGGPTPEPIQPVGKWEARGRAVGELFTAPVKGIRDAFQETIDLGLEVGNQLNNLTDGTVLDFMSRPVFYYDKEKGLQFMPDKSGNIEEGTINLPDPTGEMKSTIGNVEKSVVQFVTGFVLAGKVLKPIKALQGAPIATSLAKGALGTFAAFDGHEQRLSNLVQSVDPKWRPGVVDTVTKFLQADEEDPELVGRLKGALEDAAFGSLVEPVILGIRSLRAAMRVKDKTKATTFEEAAKQLSTDYEAILKAENAPVDQVDNLLGPSTSTTFTVKPSEPIRAYHGTADDFVQFDPAKPSTAMGNVETRQREGFWFTNVPEEADAYAHVSAANKEGADFNNPSGMNIRPVNLDLKNPKILDMYNKDDAALSDNLEVFKAQGYDGVILKYGPDDPNASINPNKILVFDEKSIKSQFEMSGKVEAGMAPVQYGNQTIHVNFNKIDTPDDLLNTVKEMQANRAVPKTKPTGFHTSYNPIQEVKETPLWFALNEDDAKGWYTNSVDQRGIAHTYKAEIKGKIAKYTDPNVRKILSDKGIDVDEYANDLVSNPASDEVLNHPGTKVLQENGYGGLIHSDYNPNDFDKNADSMIVFDPKKSMGEFKEVTMEAPQNTVSTSGTKPGGRPIAPPVNPFKNAQVPGTESTWDLMMASRAKRIKNGQSNPMRADDQESLKALYVSASNKLNEVIGIARKAPTSENLFAFRKMLSTFGIINNELIGVRHETNRAVNIWRKSELVPMRRMKDIEETLERTGGIEDNKKLLDQLGIFLDSDKSPGLALAKMAQASRRYGTVRAIRNTWTLGLLTNWKTHEVNAISNTMMMFITAAERGTAAKYTKAMNIDNGVAPGEAGAMLSGMWQSLDDAMRNAGRTFRSGEGGGAFNKVEAPFEHNVFEDADTALKKFVNTSMWYWGGIGRGLQASDEFFKTLNFSAAVNSEIQRKVYWEVEHGATKQADMTKRITELKNDVPEDILLKAEDMSRYATFTKEPGKITKSVARFLNAVPGARYIVPFINTPSNLFNATIERTPFAPAQKQFRDAVRRGGADEALAMTKMTLGSTFMAMSMNKAFDGEVTGSGPPFWSKDYAKWKAQGKQPYSIKRGDKWVAYNRFDPMGMVLGLGADMAEKLQSIDESDAESLADYQEILAGATFSVASQITSKTSIQGAANLFDALNNYDVSANSFVQMFAGGLIPAGVGELARQIDPTQREAYDFITKWKSRLPGLSSTLEPKLDMWGREQKYGTGNPLIDVINPISITKENITPIDKEFNLQGYSIPKSIESFQVDGAKINLKNNPALGNRIMVLSRQTPPSQMGNPETKEIKKLLRKYGDYSMHDLMNMIVTGNHPLYQKYSTKSDGLTGEKVNMLKSIYRDYMDAAKTIVINDEPEIQGEVIEQQMQRDTKAKDIATERVRDSAGDAP